VAEGHIVTHRDAQVANLVANRTLPRRKPLFIVLPLLRKMSRKFLTLLC
jgi:hypothetical protein